jgi:hypothetical protein
MQTLVITHKILGHLNVKIRSLNPTKDVVCPSFCVCLPAVPEYIHSLKFNVSNEVCFIAVEPG